ncbi:hypothetical protein EYZ11_009143 [Aspergillus tanneri]|uniref:Xylanolytic transcriptional activator regulatory domain-containing protein n=1 Tax=Aspergillus tanneri TaxID=1220188 RepID=A0A4V3UNI6_9EURO|nr:uncharacterized protein ATNIH1004_008137 [Aspergillus tanneri]KAA8643941.1 hypothetical protein ATNIH1004_008137 [Aspergillus tanneri]THC91394.1 hypothetical protein EYZ11_009143 [Aspergillus tanneri]
MEMTFHISQDGKTPKRKYTPIACDACRKRKKKCHHEEKLREWVAPALPRGDRKFIHHTLNASHGLQPSQLASATSRMREPRPHDEQRPSRVQPSRRGNNAPRTSGNIFTHRFIGDLNPVVFFMNDASTRLIRGRAHQSDVGEWLEDEDEILEDREGTLNGRLLSNEIQLREFQRSSALLPTRQSQEGLIDVYFRHIHPVLPLIDEYDFRTLFREGTASPYLLQAVCLVASKHHEARPFLLLSDRADTVPLETFSNLLYDDLTHAVAMKRERKKATMIQVLALLSLHAPGPESFEDASMYLTQAIHHAYTIGLHLTKGVPAQNEISLVALFWCLWSLDRWNAAIHGRPLISNDRDIGQQLTDVIDLFEAPFRVWLSLASTMGEVMVVYRPTLDTPVNGNKPEIPRFEEVLDSCNGWNMSSEQLLFLELAYHAIAVLASRAWGLKNLPRAHTLYLRQDLSVYRMATLTQMCEMGKFLPLPVVSYAISLGFSISYKQLKRCQLPSTQHTAKRHLQTFYKSLEALGQTWWSAQVMSRLGQRALDGIHRMAERANQNSAMVNYSEKDATARPNTLASFPCDVETPSSVRGDYSDASPMDEAAATESQARLVNQALLAETNPLSFDFANIDHDNWSNFTADPMFEGIDNFLGNFLDINIPKGSTRPVFMHSDVARNSGSLDYSGLYQ